MIRNILLTILCSLFISINISAQSYRTQAISEDIHSIQLQINNDWNSYPVIRQNSTDHISISFDNLSAEQNMRLRYRLVMCNADWTPNTEVSEIEYLNGFDDNAIENYATSVNTTVPYTHYSLELPNNDVSFKLPGNYAIEVYAEDDYEKNVLLTACFSVLDEQTQIMPSVSSVTNIDANNEHHQVSFDLNYSMNLRDIKNDLQIFVRQNNRLDNEKKNIKPNYIMPSKLRYINNKDLIFKAGNEYHRFDMSSYRHKGKNIAHIVYERPFYHSYVVPNRLHEDDSYVYDQDQNGRVIYRTTDADNINTEGDYIYTHITLHSDEKLPYDIFLNGALTYNLLDDKYKMQYDEENREYILILPLKQGIYNYQYLIKNGVNYSTKEIMGDFYETENEYSIYVYYRPMGQKYDSLVGFTRFQSREK